ncbi:MAG: hypothetical protein EXX96DRAFT_554347 [Benjaminiella poitrasii]|nr:MAG: hypothetical protein EXX96DRAFT_554347 [Benjaminiella poitrasii]
MMKRRNTTDDNNSTTWSICPYYYTHNNGSSDDILLHRRESKLQLQQHQSYQLPSTTTKETKRTSRRRYSYPFIIKLNDPLKFDHLDEHERIQRQSLVRTWSTARQQTKRTEKRLTLAKILSEISPKNNNSNNNNIDDCGSSVSNMSRDRTQKAWDIAGNILGNRNINSSNKTFYSDDALAEKWEVIRQYNPQLDDEKIQEELNGEGEEDEGHLYTVIHNENSEVISSNGNRVSVMTTKPSQVRVMSSNMDNRDGLNMNNYRNSVAHNTGSNIQHSALVVNTTLPSRQVENNNDNSSVIDIFVHNNSSPSDASPTEDLISSSTRMLPENLEAGTLNDINPERASGRGEKMLQLDVALFIFGFLIFPLWWVGAWRYFMKIDKATVSKQLNIFRILNCYMATVSLIITGLIIGLVTVWA